jgi:CBS domain-containing protein/gamma-glutamylcysteine synthetase
MGDLNVRIVSNQKQLNNFTKYLLKDVQALEKMLKEGWFNTDPIHIGAEQEMCLVDENYKPSPKSLEVLSDLRNKTFTTELAKFNLEANIDPLVYEKDCFSRLEKNLDELLQKVRGVASDHHSDVILTGILPTIRKFDLDLENLTPLDRYFALVKAINKLRGKIYELRIEGIDELNIKHDSAMLEACNTSFQVHLQIKPEEFVRKYNAAQVLMAPVMAVAANSPMLFGKRLWKETRVALFQQSVDTRVTSEHLRDRSPRVTFGNKWLENSIVELYKEDIVRFKVMLMTDVEEDVFQMLEDGITPSLRALMIHNSTVYRWNRPCYGVSPNGKPHLRIENRCLPSGPSILDEVANSAFWIGLMSVFDEHYNDIPHRMDFDDAKSNFVATARLGMDTALHWFHEKKYAVSELIQKELLPLAREGLEKFNVDKDDIDRYLGVIQERNDSRKTGSSWMLRSYSKLAKTTSKEELSIGITASILKNQKQGKPIHTWDLASLEDISSWQHSTLLAEEFMTTDLFTIIKDDIPEMVAEIMDWQKIRYMPIEDDKGRLIGLISSRMLLRYFSRLNKGELNESKTIKDLMITNPIHIGPETTVMEAMNIMQEKRIGCLPVVKSEKLIGIITEENFLNISASLLNRLGKEKNFKA